MTPSSMTKQRLWLLLGICVALRAVSLFRPCLSDDEATYCVVGREMLTKPRAVSRRRRSPSRR